MVGLPVLIVLIMRSPYTKPPPYDFLNLYGACLETTAGELAVATTSWAGLAKKQSKVFDPGGGL
jgi:hypothetical protein